MRKMIGVVLLLLLLCCVAVYGDIDYSWSLDEIGIENAGLGGKTNFTLRMGSFSWVETFTGLGFGFSLFNIHGEWPGVTDVLPVEFMWNPVSTRLWETGMYGTLGLYDQMTWLRAPIFEAQAPLSHNFGIRYIISTIPYGRTKEKADSNYRVNLNVFAEYSTYKTWRVGISADVGFLLALILSPIFYLTEKPIDEGKL